MPDRLREQVVRSNGGRHGRFTDGPEGPNTEYTKSVAKCADIVGSGDNAPFRVDHFESSGGVIDKAYTGYFSSWFQNYTCDYVQGLYNGIEHLGLDTMGTIEAATKGAARTNPSRPSVDLPSEIAQLHELPDIIRQAGENELGRVGGANLGYQFGVAPIISDVNVLLDVQRLIAIRAQELDRAYRAGGIKRTVVVDAGSHTESINTFLQTDGLFIREPVNWFTGEVVKVHARWTSDGSYDYSRLGQDDRAYALYQQARRAVTGGIIDGATAWELIPWSWLVDYFGTAGEYFKAQRNIVGMVLSDVAVMRHTVTKVTCSGPSNPGDYSFSSFAARLETKTRKTSFVAPTLSSESFLNSNQVGILASLAATRYT
ncbi:maturation protein [ssRNA phage Esthiorhiza.2_33]|uniref:Maturation protein n=2 Tax=Leviviricetes TaxID=2842243 RepID=A0A8S5L3Z1_9VIRU|nr:maturation protein [ssRNA phage Esthiorhiza.2_33]QDH91305.1 MAG: hypothetical protein H2RhizoLitter491933_000003 [Leviviridae sp.]DAD52235.1 TPA_asm: maturation protein [ssRNA phage Esthiorhiza.2_33]